MSFDHQSQELPTAVLGGMLGRRRLRAPATGALLVMLLGTGMPARAGETQGALVYLSDIAPSIRQDMRYAGTNNFTGRPVSGYEANQCMLLEPVASALARVQEDLEKQRLSLVVYDCYRPERAGRALVDWSRQPEDGATQSHYPRLQRGQLFDLGYIARTSKHSRGNAVDVTVLELTPGSLSAQKGGPATAPCTEPATRRAHDGTIDMGTAYDCFDTASHTDAASVSSDARRWRRLLREAMGRQGFLNYSREWWHFSLGSGSGPFDVPVRAKPN